MLLYRHMATLLKNKKATFDFSLEDRYEAGIELLGGEVKSLRKSQGKLDGAHVIIRGDEAYLVGMSIPPYQRGATSLTYDSERPRRLLLNRKELNELAGTESQKGLTIVPISLYTKGRHIKLEIAVARGKKKFDKRESIKKKDTRRDIEREFKQKMR